MKRYKYIFCEPECTDFYPEVRTERIYLDDGIEMIDYDEALIAKDFGVRIISIDYDEPIKNTFD